MNIGAIIQSRIGSSRLPGKILKKISGKEVLYHVEERLSNAKRLNATIIATTELAEDDQVVQFAKNNNYLFFRGSQDDVLARYYHAAKENNLDTIIRVTSDCPCIDPVIVDELIEIFTSNSYDYVTNCLERSYPRGLDVEVFSFKALKKAYDESTSAYQREHVTEYIMTNPQEFKIFNKVAPDEIRRPDIRITVDTAEDFMLVSAIFDYLYFEKPLFTAPDIVNLFNEKPWLSYITKDITQKDFDSEIDELVDAEKILKSRHMERASQIISNHLQVLQKDKYNSIPFAISKKF